MDPLKERLREHHRERSTHELQQLLRARDPDAYRPEAYEVMEEVVRARVRMCLRFHLRDPNASQAV